MLLSNPVTLSPGGGCEDWNGGELYIFNRGLCDPIFVSSSKGISAETAYSPRAKERERKVDLDIPLSFRSGQKIKTFLPPAVVICWLQLLGPSLLVKCETFS